MVIIPLIFIILISSFVFLPTFSLGIFGDDWLAFFRYAQHLGPKSPGVWNYLTYYLTPYGPQDILMGLLNKVFGFESTPYYIFSFTFRMIAAISFYPLVYYLTKSRLASLFAILFFSITTTGLDATNWVFNMPSYITIALFNICLYFFLKQRETSNALFLILSAIFYYFAYITTPIRMHGSLLFILLLEIFWVIQERKFSVSKKATLRFATMLGVFLIVRYTGHSQGPTQEASERFLLGIKAMSEMLSNGRFDFFFYPILMFGSMIIPDSILSTASIISKSSLFWTKILPFFLCFSLFSLFIWKNIFTLKLYFFRELIISLILWTGIVTLVHQFNKASFSNSRYFLLVLIGGSSIILAVFLIIKFFKQKNISTGLFLGLSWSICSFLFAWWWVPTSIFPTIYRYLIVSAVGISIILAVIISMGKSRQERIVLSALFFCLIIVHITATRLYLDNLLNYHGQEISNKIWSSIPHIPKIGQSKNPIIFYFEGDNTNGAVLHDVITFGFPPHMALLYNLREEDGGFPVPMSELKDVISAATDGKVMRAYGYPEEKVPLDRIYAFHLQGKNNLINITNQAREKLKEFIH